MPDRTGQAKKTYKRGKTDQTYPFNIFRSEETAPSARKGEARGKKNDPWVQRGNWGRGCRIGGKKHNTQGTPIMSNTKGSLGHS